AESFGSAFSIDPWLISAGFHACGMVDFKQREGLECLAESVEELLACARKKYKHYGIDQEPYVYIKADSGTYGMGVMTVNSARDVLEMNKKERNKMHVIKEGTQVHEVIIQEGIPTIDRVDGKPAEPMIYLVGGCPTGGMFRVNGARDPLNNLNAKGMEFTGMCDQNELMPDMEQVKNCHFRSFGLIASLSALAAAREDYDNKLEIPGCKEA
ncbi:MAG: glutamate--cysteine ligase, partial [Alphaproteobacteria bacterium]